LHGEKSRYDDWEKPIFSQMMIYKTFLTAALFLQGRWSMNSVTKTQTPALPDFNDVIIGELDGLGEYGRVSLTVDIVANKLARYTVTREKSVKGGDT
jgi:hypothetical protein